MPRVTPGIFLVTLSLLTAPLALHAGWRIDPDYRPILHDGFTLYTIGGTQVGGKTLAYVGGSPKRLLDDGSVDTTYQPPAGLTPYAPSPTGPLFAYQTVSTSGNGTFDLLWLDDAGIPTGTKATLTGSTAGILSGPNGTIIIQGGFSAVNGVPRNGLARLNSDGSLDTSFDAGTAAISFLISQYVLQPDGKLLLAGAFTSFGGIPREQMVRLNLDGTVDLTFDGGPEISNGFSSPYTSGPIAVEASGTLLRMNAGTLRRCDADGGNRTVIAQIDNTGTSSLDSLIALPTGKILIGGYFTKVNNTSAANLARLNADGSLDTSFNPGFAVAAYPTLYLYPDGRILVVSNGRTFRLLADGGIDTTFNPSVAATLPASVFAVASASGNRTVIGGAFSYVENTFRSTLAVLNADGSVDTTFDPGPGVSGAPAYSPDNPWDTSIRSITVQPDGNILVAGRFTLARGVPRDGFARFLATGALDTTFSVDLDDGAYINCSAVQSDGHIVIGGTFTTVNGSPRAHLARLNTDGSLDNTFALTTGITGVNAVVNSVSNTSDGHILVAGFFDAYNGARRWSVARLNSDGSLDTTFDPGSSTSGDTIASATETMSGGTAVVSMTSLKLLSAVGAHQFTDTQPFPESSPSGRVVLSDGQGGVISIFAQVERAEFSSKPYGTIERFMDDGTRDGTVECETNSGFIYAQTLTTNGEIIVAGAFAGLDGISVSNLARLIPDTSPTSHLANISTRAYVGTGDEQLIAGFVVTGTESQRAILRGIGPSLSQTFGVAGAMTHPALAILPSGNTPVPTLLYWLQYNYTSRTTLPQPRMLSAMRHVGAFDLIIRNPQDFDTDTAFTYELQPGAYTVQLSGQTAGAGLVEIYDLNGIGADRHIVNLSTRGRVSVAGGPLIGGFVISGGTKRVLVRAIGPGLAQFNVDGTLANPHLDVVRSSDNSTVGSNDNWEDGGQSATIIAANTESGAFALANGSTDSALVLTLPDGGYTALVSGVNNAEGIALVEIYELSGP